MNPNTSAAMANTILFASTFVASTLLFSIYLVFSRWPVVWFMGHSDILAMAASALVPLAYAYRKAQNKYIFVVVGVVYVAVCAVWLQIYGLYFVCTFFSHCL